MNTQQARSRVAETFPQPFNRTKFLEFCRNLLNKFDESKAAQWNATYVKDAFKPHVSRFERLGTYTSPDDEKLDVLVVHLTNESKLERARAAIRNFVADHLKTRDEKDAALVAFVSPTEKQWRFSYVKMEYAAVETESGKVGVETRLTPARRFSYIVGEGESCHTAQTRFLALLQDTENFPSLTQLEDAFSVEAVTKEFFNQYAALFGEIDAALQKLAAKDPVIGKEFKAKNVSTVDFAKKLMGQIVFLYFLQKKGWLGVAKGQDWGTGPHDFLRRLARGDYGAYENFFNDVLEPLFYDTLAIDRENEAWWCKIFKCRIPFLNGGLFEPLGDYDWRKTDITLPNKLFTNTERNDAGDIGTGVLDVFDRYNFTVNEAEPLEKEVAIDPEMLGKVFENLIEENRRKGLGSFYTPREIVHYMCQESLINYLDTSVNTPTANVPRAELETLVHLGDQISHYEAVDTRYVGREMPRKIKEHAKLIDDKLADITVCDPAVGSGAFPVGMMTEIVRARSALTPYFNDVNDRTPYHFKRHAIQNCLYGVDIDPGAVEIAKLRLWLSLVVDEEDVKQIKPLPNLFYKIVTGNSLLGVEKNLFNQQLFQQLEKLKVAYFDQSDQSEKSALRQKIDHLIHELTNGKEAFDFEIYFSEVFHRKGGFDVVIGNPPYVLLQDENKNAKLRDLYKKEFVVASYKIDLYHLFIERGMRLLNRVGNLAFITPANFLSNNYAVPLRRFLLTESALRKVIVFEDGVFAASVNNVVFSAEKKEKALTKFFRASVSSDGLRMTTVREAPQQDFCKGDYLLIPAESEGLAALVGKLEGGATTLGTVASVSFGMQLRDREKFPRDVLEGKATTLRLSRDHRPCYTGKDISRWLVTFNDRYCYFNREAKRGGCWAEEMHNAKNKLLLRQIGHYPDAALDREGYAVLNTAFMVVLKKPTIHPEFLLAVLNSNVIRCFWLNKFKDDRNTFPKIKGEYLKLLPIPAASSEKQRAVERLVDRILAEKTRDASADVSAWEREIDQLVYALYGLTPEEIQIVEGASAKATADKGAAK
jgi:type I restriction-modification system DNA methylase subunit